MKSELFDPTKVSFSILIAFVALMATSSELIAQDKVERPKNGTWVTDETNTFSSEELTALNGLCAEVRQKSGAELVVVMIPSTDGVYYVEFAEKLFNLWEIGNREEDNGILVFVAKQDRKFQIMLGDGIDTNGQVAMTQDIFERVVKSNFRDGKFGEGTYLAAFQCAEQILGIQDLDAPKSLSEVTLNLPGNSQETVVNPAPHQPDSTSQNAVNNPSNAVNNPSNAVNNPPVDVADQTSHESPEAVTDEILQDIRRRTDPNFGRPQNNVAPKRRRDKGPLMLLFMIAGGSIGVGGIALVGGRFLLRGRMRVCPKCQSAMEKLDEQQDDEYLEPPELVEERIGSVNYDVWACMTCEDVVKLRYGVFFSRYSNCPQCRRKTKNKISRTLVPATERSGGVVEVTETCANCSYRNQYTYQTPRKHRSSSGMSSRLGGGRGSSSRGGRSSSSGGGRSFGGGRTSGRGGGGGW